MIKRYTVYPRENSIKIIGSHVTKLNEALECWSKALEIAGKGLKEEDVAILSNYIRSDFIIDPYYPEPGKYLALIGPVEMRSNLEKLDYVQAWALIKKLKES